MSQLTKSRASLPRTTRSKSPTRAASGTFTDVRARLLDAAESLFAERGIEAVSLREIAAQAEQRNNSAVIYHFGDKRGLLDALIADRVGKVECARRRLIERAADLSRCDAATLLKLLWQPLMQIDAKRDRHYFIHFQLAYQVQNKGSEKPTSMDPIHHPASAQIMAELEMRFAHLSAKQMRYRLRLTAMMFWSAVAWHDHMALSPEQRLPYRFSLEETTKLAVAALATQA
jgi:AcrR family transcriptional regulator